MDKICERCGSGIQGEDEAYCPDCKREVQYKNKKRLRHSVAAVSFLLLAGLVFWYGAQNAWDFSWDTLLDRPVALVNGEPIARTEARERLNVSKVMLEKEYGKGLFAGEQGRALLGRLERDVLEKMVEERLVAQEASRMKIQVGDDRVQQEIRKIGSEIYGNWDNFQASLKEDGVSQEYLANHIRNLLLGQEVKKAKFSPAADPDAAFVGWLVQNRRSAKVTLNQTIALSPGLGQGQSSCCGSGAGGGAVGCGTK